MQKNKNIWLASLPLILILGLMIWLFSDIVAYILLAAALSSIGHPIVRLLDKIRIKRFNFPHALSSFIALLFLLAIITTAVFSLAPVISKQAKVISSIDFALLRQGLEQPLYNLESFMYNVDMLKPGETLTQIITDKLISLTQLSILDI